MTVLRWPNQRHRRVCGSSAGGLLAGFNVARQAEGLPLLALPAVTMMGALFHYVTHAEPSTSSP